MTWPEAFAQVGTGFAVAAMFAAITFAAAWESRGKL